MVKKLFPGIIESIPCTVLDEKVLCFSYTKQQFWFCFRSEFAEMLKALECKTWKSSEPTETLFIRGFYYSIIKKAFQALVCPLLRHPHKQKESKIDWEWKLRLCSSRNETLHTGRAASKEERMDDSCVLWEEQLCLILIRSWIDCDKQASKIYILL